MTDSQSSSDSLWSRLSRMIPAHVTSTSSRPLSAASGDRRLDVRARGDVAADRAPADPLGGLLRGRLVEVRDDDVRSLAREALGGRGADTARAAGDERRLALEPPHRIILRRARRRTPACRRPPARRSRATTPCSPPGTSSTDCTVKRRADPRAGRDGRREAHLVDAVVDAHPVARELQRLGHQRHAERERQEAVRDRRAERPLGGARRIGVDPLRVVGRARRTRRSAPGRPRTTRSARAPSRSGR